MQIRASYNHNQKMSARFRQRALRITPALLQAEEQNALAYKQAARKFSSGNLSEQTQRRIARLINNNKGLYATASPAALAPGVINRQSGFLLAHWQTVITWQKDGTQVTLFNTAPYAKYLFAGTLKMIARPIMQLIYAQERAQAVRRLDRAFKLSAMK